MTTNDACTPGLVAPLEWPWARSAAPLLTSEHTSWRGGLLRRWSGTSSVMEQPPLDHHYAVMHLGGAKNVTRRRDGPAVSTLADNGSITLVPAGTSYVWRTEGPISFAHLYIRPDQLAAAIARDSPNDGSPSNGAATLIERIGCRDPILEPLFAAMIGELGASSSPSTLRLDCLFESFAIRLARRHASAVPGRAAHAVALAPHRLRRVLDYVDAHLGANIGLADLVGAAGTSQFHFSRAFRLAVGSSPYRYLLRRRIELARVLLLSSDETLESVGRLCGFNSRHQFSLMFKSIVGVGPKRFRLDRRASPAADPDHASLP